MTSIPAWIARFTAVSPACGLYHAIRYLGFPRFRRIERALPRSGRVLDLGCGYGLFALLAADRAPGRDVLGLDPLAERIRVGRAVIARFGGPANARLEHGDLDSLGPEERFDAISVTDVLFYSPHEEQLRLLEACRRRLAPGGLLLVKEQVRAPAWKAALVRAQEELVVSLKVKIGRSRAWAALAPGRVHLWDQDELVRSLASEGARVTGERLDRGSYLSHYLVSVRVEGETLFEPDRA